MMRRNPGLLLSIILISLFYSDLVDAMQGSTQSDHHLIIIEGLGTTPTRLESLFFQNSYTKIYTISYPVVSSDWFFYAQQCKQKEEFLSMIKDIKLNNPNAKITVYAAEERAAESVNWIHHCSQDTITNAIFDKPKLMPNDFWVSRAMCKIAGSIKMLIIQPKVMIELENPLSSKDACVFYALAKDSQSEDKTNNTYLLIEGESEKIEPSLIDKILTDNSLSHIHTVQDFETTMMHNYKALESKIILTYITTRLLLVSAIIFATYKAWLHFYK